MLCYVILFNVMSITGIYNTVITPFYSIGKGGYVFGSVGLSICGQHYSKSCERIGIKFYGGTLGSTMKN